MYWYINDFIDRNFFSLVGIFVYYVFIVRMVILFICVFLGWYVNDIVERYFGGLVVVFIKGIVCVVFFWYIYDVFDGNFVCKFIIGGCFFVFVGNFNLLYGDVDDFVDGNFCVV